MIDHLKKFIFAVFLITGLSTLTIPGQVSAQEECPVDLGELEVQADLAIPVLGDTIDLANGLLDTLAPIQLLDTTGALDPLVGSLLDLVNNSTALLENLQLLAGADTANEQCMIAADICAQGQGLFTLIGTVPGTVESTLDTALPLPIVGSLLSGVLDQVFGLTDFLLGTVDPVVGNLIAVSCSQEAPVEECEFIEESPVCADSACAQEEIAEGVTCDDFNDDPESFCGDEVSCDDPNCAGTDSCPVPECEFTGESPNCADPLCAVEEVAEGITCDAFTQDPESYCGDEVSCDDPNCAEAVSCSNTGQEQPPAGGGNGGGCTVAGAATVSLGNLLLPLLPLAGILVLRRRRRKI